MGRKRYVVRAGKSGGTLTSREMGPVSEAVWPQGGTWLPLPRMCDKQGPCLLSVQGGGAPPWTWSGVSASLGQCSPGFLGAVGEEFRVYELEKGWVTPRWWVSSQRLYCADGHRGSPGSQPSPKVPTLSGPEPFSLENPVGWGSEPAWETPAREHWAGQQNSSFTSRRFSELCLSPSLAIPETENQVKCCAVRCPGGRSPGGAVPEHSGFSVWSWSWELGALHACALLGAELVLVSWNCQGAWDTPPPRLPLPGRGASRQPRQRGQNLGASKENLSASLWPKLGLTESQSALRGRPGESQALCVHTAPGSEGALRGGFCPVLGSCSAARV